MMKYMKLMQPRTPSDRERLFQLKGLRASALMKKPPLKTSYIVVEFHPINSALRVSRIAPY